MRRTGLRMPQASPLLSCVCEGVDLVSFVEGLCSLHHRVFQPFQTSASGQDYQLVTCIISPQEQTVFN